MTTSDRIMKYASLLAFVVCSVGEMVAKKRATYGANYPEALTLLTAVVGAIAYPLLVLALLAARAVQTSQLGLPLWKPACVAALFMLHNTCLNAGAGGKAVPGVLVGVLVKTAIPISMLLNMPKATLGLTYKPLHGCSFIVVLLGAFVTVDMSGLSLPPSVVTKMGLIVFSVVPLAVGFMLVELILRFQHKELFAIALWTWICFFQSAWSLALLPLSAWLSNVSLAQMVPNLHEGLVCYVTGVAPPSGEGLDCGEAARYWWASVAFGLFMNMGMAASTRYGGATLMWFAKALTVPLAAVCFAQAAIMGSHAVPGNPLEYLGVMITFVGVLLFNAVEPTTPSESDGIDEAQLLES